MSTELLSERLRLRPWRTGDLASLVELFAKPEVWRYPLRRAFTNDESRAFLTRMTDRQRTGMPKGTMCAHGYVARFTGGELLVSGPEGPAKAYPLDDRPRVVPVRVANQRTLDEYWRQRATDQEA